LDALLVATDEIRFGAQKMGSSIHGCAANYSPDKPLPNTDDCRITQFSLPPFLGIDVATIIELIQIPMR
jgi:hypothetical protein